MVVSHVYCLPLKMVIIAHAWRTHKLTTPYPLNKILMCTRDDSNITLLHIVPFCEGPNEKPKGFAKQKQKI
jgi:hypothetical protein